ncbi:MAG TPA: hypothetical protein VK172_08145 [Lentimicrobium sp.]|nr:hypothetical protein [Lentimicrobium sp.]
MFRATVPEWSWCCNSSEAASYNAKAQSRGGGIKRKRAGRANLPP